MGRGPHMAQIIQDRIQELTEQGGNASVIHKILVVEFPETTPSMRTTVRWVRNFASLEDQIYTSRLPVTVSWLKNQQLFQNQLEYIGQYLGFEPKIRRSQLNWVFLLHSLFPNMKSQLICLFSDLYDNESSSTDPQYAGLDTAIEIKPWESILNWQKWQKWVHSGLVPYRYAEQFLYRISALRVMAELPRDVDLEIYIGKELESDAFGLSDMLIAGRWPADLLAKKK
jgi:hypothetical protein